MDTKTPIIILMVVIAIIATIAGWQYPQNNNGWVVSLIFQFMVSIGLIFSVRTFLKNTKNEKSGYSGNLSEWY